MYTIVNLDTIKKGYNISAGCYDSTSFIHLFAHPFLHPSIHPSISNTIHKSLNRYQEPPNVEKSRKNGTDSLLNKQLPHIGRQTQSQVSLVMLARRKPVQARAGHQGVIFLQRCPGNTE